MRENERNALRKAGQASTIGLVLVISIVIGYALGSWLDGTFGTGQIFTLIFTLLGIVAGFIEVIRIAISLSKEE